MAGHGRNRMSHGRHPGTPRRAAPARGLAGMLLALAAATCAPAARGAQECRFEALHGAGSAALTRQGSLSVGERDHSPLAALQRVLNHGPHDIRLTFDGAAPRQLARGAREPGGGRFAAGVALRSVECLPERSAQ